MFKRQKAGGSEPLRSFCEVCAVRTEYLREQEKCSTINLKENVGEGIAVQIKIRAYEEKDAADCAAIWNEVVEEGVAFPQTEVLTEESGHAFFSAQSYTGLAYNAETGEIVGLYILHPNNVGRCGHICNASYAVKSGLRGQLIGEKLVRHCMERAKQLGFGILQFNAVVKTNLPALRLYQKLGFVPLGVIPGGFRMKDGSYEDIIPHYHLL